MEIIALNKKFKTFRIDNDDESINDKFKCLEIQENEDDKSVMSIVSEDEYQIVFTEEEKLFNLQIKEYAKHPYEQPSSEFDDSDDEEIIGYDSPEEDSQHSGYNSQYEENEEDEEEDDFEDL